METPRRRRRKKKTPNSKQLLIAGCVIGAVALIVAACFFLGGGTKDEGPVAYDPNRGPLKELKVNSLTRKGETMVVDTSYGEVEYPYAFSDLIQVESLNQDNQTALAFSARINNEDKALYTVWFNGSEGQTVGAFDLQDGEKPVLITVVFYQPGAELVGDDRTTYYATQETVNDVLTALQRNQNFSTIA